MSKLREFFAEGIYPSSKDPDGGKKRKEDRQSDRLPFNRKEGDHSPSDDAEALRWKHGVDEGRPGQFTGGSLKKTAAGMKKRGDDFKKRWPDSTPKDDDEGEHSPSDDAEAQRWKHGVDEAKPTWVKGGKEPSFAALNRSRKKQPDSTPKDDDEGEYSPSDDAEAQRWKHGVDEADEKPRCNDCVGTGWNYEGTGRCLTCNGMGTADGSNPMDKEFDNIEQYEQEVWDYAQGQHNVSAAKLNSMGKQIKDAFNNDVPPDQFVDEFLRGGFGEAYNPDTMKPKEYWDDKHDTKKHSPKDDYADYADWEKTPKKVKEAQGERAASKSNQYGRKGQGEKARQDNFKATGEPQIDDPGFAGKNPDDDMFFGGKDADDYVGTVTDPKSTDDDFSADNSNELGFGDSSSDFLDSEIGPDDVDSIWSAAGQQEPPGYDVSFPSYEPKKPARGSHWWDNREPRFVSPKNPGERHSDIENAPSFPDEESEYVKNLLRKGK